MGRLIKILYLSGMLFKEENDELIIKLSGLIRLTFDLCESKQDDEISVMFLKLAKDYDFIDTPSSQGLEIEYKVKLIHAN